MKPRNLPMKIMVLLSSLFVVVLCSTIPANAQTSTRTISVTGSSDVKVVPDEVVLSLGVEIWNADLNTAKTNNDEIVKKVLSLAPTYNVKPEDAETNYINIAPTYDTRNDSNNHLITGYFVRKTITFVLHDLTKFEDLLSASIQAGANYVYGINFQTTSLRKYRDQARSLAIQAAKEKADALAKQLGMTVGKAISIQEYPTGYNFQANSINQSQNAIQGSSAQGPADDSSQTTFAPGQIDITASVSVTFDLE